MSILVVFLLYKRRVCALTAVFRLWEFWAMLGLGLLMLIRLPDSLLMEYGVQKTKYYLVNNMVFFFGPVLASAVWGRPGLHRFLRGVFLGGLALTVYFWLSGSYLDLSLNIYAVLNFNPIELSRLIGLFILLVVIGKVIIIPDPFALSMAVAAGAAMILLNARGPALALVIALLSGGLMEGRWKFRLLPLLAVPLLIILAVFISSNYWFSQGFFSIEDNGRWQLYQAALAAFAQNPVTGAGTGSYACISPVPGISYPHNLFLESAVELGLPGLALSLLFVFAPLARLVLWRKKAKEIALAVSLLVFCLVNSMLSGDIPGNYTLWLAAGVAASLAVIAAEEYQ
jgi:O-antigen ligase